MTKQDDLSPGEAAVGGEAEHPLRADPLQSLPDAVSVPRPSRRRPRSPSLTDSAPSSPNSPQHHSNPSSSSSNKFFSLSATPLQDKEQQQRILEQFKETMPNDPLRVELNHVLSSLPSSPPPPSGKAYATDIDALLDHQEKQQHKLKNHSNYEEKLFVEGQELTNDSVITDISIYPLNDKNEQHLDFQSHASGMYIIESKKIIKLHLNLLTEQQKQQHLNQQQKNSRAESNVENSTVNQENTTDISSDDKDNTIEEEIVLPSNLKRVGRSISDFHWLYRRLTLYYDGIIIPSLPSMSITTRMKNGPLHDKIRLNGLYRFLYRLTIHPILSKGPELVIFTGHSGEEEFKHLRSLPLPNKSSLSMLVVDDNDENLWKKLLWQTGKKVNQGLVWLLQQNSHEDVADDVEHHEANSTSMSDSTNNRTINQSNTGGNVAKKGESGCESSRKKEESGKDRLERLGKYVKELGPGLSNVRYEVNKVIKNRDSEDRALENFEEALQDVAKKEGGKFASYLSNIGRDSSPTATELGKGKSAKGRAKTSNRRGVAGRLLEDILEDYEERSKGAQRIMSARQEEQETYERALERYKSLRDELEANNELALESAEELELKLTEASRRLGKVRKQYQAVAIRTTDELRRLRKDLHEDLCDGLWLLATEMEKDYTQQALKWANIASIIQDYKSEIESSSNNR